MSEASRERLWNILYPNKPYRTKGSSEMADPDFKSPNDSITRAELARELALRAGGSAGISFNSYKTATALADAVVDAVNPPSKRSFRGEQFKFTELCDALRRLGYADFTTEQHARRIYNDIIDHREPKWECGDIVTSADRLGYTRTQQGWSNLDGSSTYAFEHPKRPLKKIGHTA